MNFTAPNALLITLGRGLVFAALLLLILALAACTVKPFTVTTTKGSTYRSLGGSIMTKAKTETASMTLPDGTTMYYTTTGKNETSVPQAVIAGSVAETLSGDWLSSDKAATAAEVTKAQITADKAVKITESNNAVKTAELLAVPPVPAAPQ